MSEQQPLVVVHSLTEALLYVMLSPCPSCGGSCWPQIEGCTGPDPDHRLIAAVVCGACGSTGQISYDVSHVEPTEAAGGLQKWTQEAKRGQISPINPTDNPSRAIDVGGWMMLHTMLAGGTGLDDKPSGQGEAAMIRQLRIQAGRCLAEALKFYDEDNDLPPANAFFTEVSRQQFREHPELFLRSRLASLRVKMPVDKPV